MSVPSDILDITESQKRLAAGTLMDPTKREKTDPEALIEALQKNTAEESVFIRLKHLGEENLQNNLETWRRIIKAIENNTSVRNLILNSNGLNKAIIVEFLTAIRINKTLETISFADNEDPEIEAIKLLRHHPSIRSARFGFAVSGCTDWYMYPNTDEVQAAHPHEDHVDDYSPFVGMMTTENETANKRSIDNYLDKKRSVLNQGSLSLLFISKKEIAFLAEDSLSHSVKAVSSEPSAASLAPVGSAMASEPAASLSRMK